MRRQIAIILALCLGVVAIVSAQHGDSQPYPPPVGARSAEINLSGLSGQQLPLVIDQIDLSTLAPTIDAGTTCDTAATITIPGGGQTVTNAFPTASNDPRLSCMWDTPTSTRGWRSAWYKYVPEQSGWVSFSTLGSNYDTVIAIHSGPCGNQVELACNDDFNFFTSRASYPFLAGNTYYIETVDWQAGTSGETRLNFAAQAIPVSNNWEVLTSGPSPAQRSRHAAVVVGNKIYVIGGQVILGDNPTRTSATHVFDTSAGTWTSLANMPAQDGLGYSNTTAAYVASEGKIYMPSGFIGSGAPYDGKHWAYDIGTNTWTDSNAIVPDNDWGSSGPAIYSVAKSYKWFDGTDGYFLTGGLTGPFPPEPPLTSTAWIAHDEVYYFSATDRSWNVKIPPPLLTGRFGHTAGILPSGKAGTLCVAGGMGEDPIISGARFVFSSVECLDIDKFGTWSEIAPLNYPRYFAESAVDNFGNWYVFGGYDADGDVVAVTERYDPDNKVWIPLQVQYDLGVLDPQFTSQETRPPRAWPRGGFVGKQLYAIGGEDIRQRALNLTERVALENPRVRSLPEAGRLPLVFKESPLGETDDTFATATFIGLNVSRRDRFVRIDDTVDVWRFDVPSTRNITIRLSPLKSNNELDLYLYTFNKSFVGASTQPGSRDEFISRTLSPGTYFAVVERVYPPPGVNPDSREYEIVIQG